jgi:BirA family transcriptional regulator, biotin operon repressor / biotin---[acetyl-CoA-carboxylase] ligase
LSDSIYHIKLDAIDSTNDYLKKLALEDTTKNFTFVTAKNQTNGKGQRGTVWQSEKGKNLTMSILIKNIAIQPADLFYCNVIVSCSLLQFLSDYDLKCTVKWPNDIMADSKKITGILIENVFKANGEINAIIGIGLNVNQTHFHSLPNATSMKNQAQQDFDIDQLAEDIVLKIQSNWKKLSSHSRFFWEYYHDHLFKKAIPAAFEDKEGNKFMGIIQEVSPDGKLVVVDENEKKVLFDLKQIKLLF